MWLRIEGVGQVLHVESKPAEPANLLSHIRRGGGDQFWDDGMAVSGHVGDHCGEELG